MRFNLTLLSKQIFNPKNSNKYFSQLVPKEYIVPLNILFVPSNNNSLFKNPSFYILRRNFSDTKNNSCWKCKSNNTERIFCNECGALQKIDKNIVRLLCILN